MQSIPKSNLNKLLEPETTADLLGITAGTLQVWRSTGRYNLPFVKVGGRVMYRAEDVQAFIERRLHNHTGSVA
ncbi:MAG: helix-turn-helix domain-containing protein [Sedimenticola selenatireducens]|uniref:Helix-turn-helix domain-containing protein n=1 Tax=Sedimenticola selenatireducens TaxID=191960 RepID=A0A557SM49_9GAMM|nr:helix-turn-helix domain-containing protein [Sedimenticola selenatireducens]TVO78505.1 helix-turn-helix domain-containing protein [Sedimenticola selenatireducens]TVT62829.1 MAG: helix-turn-helix domain-containing protein [Sedimenticola selenatireducens]